MEDLYIKILINLAGIISFFLAFLIIPSILRVANSKNLYDEPNKRSSHKTKIPTLGGLAIFLSFLFTYSIFIDFIDFIYIPFLIPSILIVFGIGIKDDIIVTSPLIKLLGQIIAAFIIVSLGDIRFTSLHFLLGFKLNYLSSVTLSVVVFVFLMNAINLIDGVDGLAAIISIIAIISFGSWFYINNSFHIPIFAASLLGAILAFLYYNVFSKNQKIFMGDTGSLIIGFLISIIMIKFCEFNINPTSDFKITTNSSPAISIGILIIPIIDTLRIFIFRISNGKSPFSADRNHIHHRMLTLGLSHLKITLILGLINIIFVILAFIFRNLGTIILSLLFIALGLLLSYIPSFLIKKKIKKKR